MVTVCIFAKAMKAYVNFRIVGLVAVFLVILAGSIVRMTGSGMGCPDWPKCFGQWIPPTSAEELPDNYQEIYSEKRAKKIEKFVSFLNALGFTETAKQLQNDPTLLEEQPFNVKQTYTEYGNRLVGFLAGNFILIGTIWSLFFWKRRKDLFFLSLLSLIIISIQAWFGSIVVATNLVPWTISVHMILAMVTMALEAYIIYKAQNGKYHLKINRRIRTLLWVALGIIVYQMVMGIQVRQQVDEMIDHGVAKSNLMEGFDLWYYIHRSFSWVVLVIYIYVLLQIKHFTRYRNFLLVILGAVCLEFITGILISYFEFPLGSQPIHLGAATIIFTCNVFLLYESRSKKRLFT